MPTVTNSQQVIYLDNSATTKTTDSVVEAVVKCMREDYYNPSALYAQAMKAERVLKDASATINQSMGTVDQPVLFTSGGTESNNLAILGYLQTLHGTGEILYSAAEHPAVKKACLEAQNRFDMVAREIPLRPNGSIDLQAYEAMLSDQTRLICVMHVCNETGVVMPIDEMVSLRDKHAKDARIHVDGVQGYLRIPFSFSKSGVQSYAISGHKIHAPKGIGALMVRKGVRLAPQMHGGGQQGDLRSGTENVPGVAGLQEAIASYPTKQLEQIKQNKAHLVSLLIDALPDMVINGLDLDDPMCASHILSVAFPPVRAETLLHALEGQGILVGNGSACSSKKTKHSSVLTAMRLSNGVMESTIRISLCPWNTKEEMDIVADALIKQVQFLRKYCRR